MRKMFHRLILAALVLSASVIANAASAGETLQRILDFKTLTIGTSGDQPPFTMLSKGGGIMGYDVDLAKALAAAMRVRLEIEVLSFGELLGALERGDVDMVISNMSITPERAEKVHFIGPYMVSGKSILARSSLLGEALETEAFNRKEIKLLALKNSTSETFAKEHAPNATLTAITNNDEGVAMLLAGKADALIADMATCKLAALRHQTAGLATLKNPLTVEPIGIAISSDDLQFQNLVGSYLGAYEKTGVLLNLRKKWFDDSAWVSKLP